MSMEGMLGHVGSKDLRRDFLQKLGRYVELLDGLRGNGAKFIEDDQQDDTIKEILLLQNDLQWMSDRLRVELGVPVV